VLTSHVTGLDGFGTPRGWLSNNAAPAQTSVLLIVLTGCSGFFSPLAQPTVPPRPSDVNQPPATQQSCVGRPRNVPFKAVHRLNRVEYNNTVRDLLGDTSRPADAFVPDGFTGSFTNIATGLSVSDVLAEQLESAASTLAARAVTSSAIGPQVIDCKPLTIECAQSSLFSFARKAFRRPLDDSQRVWLQAIVAAAKLNGEDEVGSLRVAVSAILLSPYFLYRLEIDPKPTSGEERALDLYELASRLSYFLWSSMPDDQLLALAEDGTLKTKLPEQVERMRKSPKAAAVIDQFIGNWLDLYQIEPWEPAVAKFPGIDAPLKSAMRKEVELLFQSLFDEDRDIRLVFDSDSSFLTKSLASHYGISGVSSTTPTEVKNVPKERRSLLGKAGLLMISSTAGDAPVVRRGQFVLSKILGEQLDFPNLPTEIKDDFEQQRMMGTLTERELLAKHSENDYCHSCHVKLDPLGFGLSAFDAVGRHVPTRDGVAVDASGQLPDGQQFNDSVSLSMLLKDDPRFVNQFTRLALTFALGKTLEGDERCAAVDLAESMASNKYQWKSFLESLATNSFFTRRTGATQ
jgi:Protein of unknown function (DUF1592)/Protein of unknown function (DUF1588)/Protein of unknown function (DUF1587)/Protein of unknown function (DUF1595)/Protein of unknown function (DUF1585)